MQLRTILAGLDLGSERRALSPGSALVAERVGPLARLEGARVVLLHSAAADEHWVEESGAFVHAPGGLPPEGRAALEAAAEALRAQGIETELVVRDERADRAILDHVVRHGVDLVLTGKRSVSERDGRRIGSVSMHLVRHCPCPVWVVRAEARSPLRSVLAATDLSEVGERAVRIAAHLAARHRATLHVVHALQLPMSVQLGGAEAEDEFVAARRREVAAAVRDQIAEEPPADVHVHVGLAAPSAAVLQAVGRFDVDLVAMGTVSRGGLPGLVVGNTAERLLERLECSLLVVKPADFLVPVEAG